MDGEDRGGNNNRNLKASKLRPGDTNNRVNTTDETLEHNLLNQKYIMNPQNTGSTIQDRDKHEPRGCTNMT